MYLIIFRLIHAIGMKKTSVRIARTLEKFARQPLSHSRLNKEIWDFYMDHASFPLCSGEFGCYNLVLSNSDPIHQDCRDKETAQIEISEAAIFAYWESRCNEYGCHEAHVKDGMCLRHWDYYNPECACGQPALDCRGECQKSDFDDVDDDDWRADEDDNESYGTVYSRAYHHYGNHEAAREAASLYPGDFI